MFVSRDSSTVLYYSTMAKNLLSIEKLSKRMLAVSIVIIFGVVFITLTLAQVLGLEVYSPFIAGGLGSLASVVLSYTLWKPHN